MSGRGLSGVNVSSSLQSTLLGSGARARLTKIQIVGDELTSVQTVNGTHSWQNDLDLIAPMLDQSVPCYIYVHRGTKEPLVCFWVPDTSSAKDKMVYSASKGALTAVVPKAEEYFSSDKSDFSKSAYTKHKAAEKPLSHVERMLRDNRSLKASDMNKSGFGLLACVENKANPAMLRKLQGRSAGAGASTGTSTRSYKSNSSSNTVSAAAGVSNLRSRFEQSNSGASSGTAAAGSSTSANVTKPAPRWKPPTPNTAPPPSAIAASRPEPPSEPQPETKQAQSEPETETGTETEAKTEASAKPTTAPVAAPPATDTQDNSTSAASSSPASSTNTGASTTGWRPPVANWKHAS
jgi:Cofilin/tropomyosin-type actin-binding protein